MSTNCIHCVKNKRTGIDLLCDECRMSSADFGKWIDANERKPSHIYSVLIWITGGAIHFNEDYCEIGIWNATRQKWQTSGIVDGLAEDVDVDVSHWMQLPPDPPKVSQQPPVSSIQSRRKALNANQ